MFPTFFTSSRIFQHLFSGIGFKDEKTMDGYGLGLAQLERKRLIPFGKVNDLYCNLVSTCTIGTITLIHSIPL